MGQPSLQDFKTAFDPTAFAQITQAELLQLVTGALPNIDKGMIVVTTDIGGVPQVPDAITNTKWQNYLWARVQAAAVTAYLWNPSSVSDPTYQKWVTITVASIPTGTVTNAMLAGGITFDKIISCAWASLTGIPSTFTPGGAAGGDLSGTYPNPIVGPNAITATKLQSDAAIDANRAVGTNHIQNNSVDFATKFKIAGVTALQLLRLNAGATAWETFTSLITLLTNPVIGNATQGVRVKADGSGFEYGASIVQVITSPFTAVDSTSTVIPYTNAIPTTAGGKQYASLSPVTITGKKVGNLLRIRFNCFVGTAGVYRAIVALFIDATATAAAASATPTLQAGDVCPLTLELLTTVPDLLPHTFKIYFGPSATGTAYMNQSSAAALFGTAALVSSLTVEEIEPS